MKTSKLNKEDFLKAFSELNSNTQQEILLTLVKTLKENPLEIDLSDYRTIKSYAGACIALKEKPINEVKLKEAGIPLHQIALMKLETISKALWGKNFKPVLNADGSSIYYYPWFTLYNKEDILRMTEEEQESLVFIHSGKWAGGGIGSLSVNQVSSCYLNAGFYLCQATDEKSKYFGKQFIKLWLIYLLNEEDIKTSNLTLYLNK